MLAVFGGRASPTPRACSNSCPLSWSCHTTISSSVIPFSSRLQSFPASGPSQLLPIFECLVCAWPHATPSGVPPQGAGILQDPSLLLLSPVQKLSLRGAQQLTSGHTASHCPAEDCRHRVRLKTTVSPWPCPAAVAGVPTASACLTAARGQALDRGAELGLGGVGLAHGHPPAAGRT